MRCYAPRHRLARIAASDLASDQRLTYVPLFGKPTDVRHKRRSSDILSDDRAFEAALARELGTSSEPDPPEEPEEPEEPEAEENNEDNDEEEDGSGSGDGSGSEEEDGSGSEDGSGAEENENENEDGDDDAAEANEEQPSASSGSKNGGADTDSKEREQKKPSSKRAQAEVRFFVTICPLHAATRISMSIRRMGVWFLSVHHLVCVYRALVPQLTHRLAWTTSPAIPTLLRRLLPSNRLLGNARPAAGG